MNTKTIPEEWKKVKLGEAFDLKQGSYIPPNEFTDQGFDIYGANGIIGKVNKYMYDNRVVLISCRGANCGVVHYTNPKSWVNNNSIAVLPKRDNILPHFLYYKFLYDGFEGFITGSAQPQIVVNVLANKKILIPTFEEQIKIAEILSSVDEEIEKVDQEIKKTEELKRGLITELLDRSKNLKIVKFSQLVKIGKDKISPKEVQNQRYIGLEHIGQGSGLLLGFGNSAETQSLKAIFKKGDILFGKLRPYLKKYWKAEFDGVCTTEILVFRPILNSDTDFIFQLVQSDKFIQYSASKSFGTKMPRTDWKIISEFKIKIPSPEERKKIAEVLSIVDSKVNMDKQIKNKLAELKRGLMQDLFSGRVRIN